MLRNMGIGVGWGMLTFHVTCVVDATQHGDWGGVGDVNVPCNMRCGCYATRGWGWGIGHVNVPCNLHALWMLRNTGMGMGYRAC